MRRIVKLTIPDELAKRADEQRGEERMRSHLLVARRSAIHGSPVEETLRGEVDFFRESMCLLVASQPASRTQYTPSSTPASSGPAQQAEEPKRKGW